MKKRTLFLALVLGMATAAMADGAAAYKKCASCHGVQGEKAALGKSKVINQMGKQEIVDALNGYKAGTYGGAMKNMMKLQVANLSDGDIQAIAEMLGK